MCARKYNIIYADPPWTMGKSHKARVYCPQYNTMDLTSICKLPVSEIAAENAALFLWCLNGQIESAITVLKSWGFTLRTVAFVWVKTSRATGQPNCRVGHWTLNGTELCLLGVRGSMRKVTNNVRQVYMGPRQLHSQKPEEIRNRIVQLFGDLPRVELFARTTTAGWDVWGNEVPCSIELGAQNTMESAPSASDNTESFQLLCDLFLEVISACENKFVIDTKSYKRKINELRSATKNIS